MKTTLALYFGNRGFFPETLIASAREEVETSLRKIGIDTISLAPEATRFGAVEGSAEGRVYADFLKQNEGKFDGVLYSRYDLRRDARLAYLLHRVLECLAVLRLSYGIYLCTKQLNAVCVKKSAFGKLDA